MLNQSPTNHIRHMELAIRELEQKTLIVDLNNLPNDVLDRIAEAILAEIEESEV